MTVGWFKYIYIFNKDCSGEYRFYNPTLRVNGYQHVKKALKI